MKYCLALFFVILASYDFTFAQGGKTIRVKAGEDVAQAYSPYGFYRFPQFGPATLYYKGGGKSGGKQFNYNLLSSTLQFIGPKGDTLDLAGQEEIDSVVFAGTTFLYDNGFLEIIDSANSVILLKKNIIKTQTENIGAYGLSNSTASITSMRTYTAGAGVYNLILNQDVVVSESVSWFFADKKRNIVKANKSNLLKLLPVDKQTKTEAWLKDNKTSFEKEPDLKKLMAAMNS